MAAARIVLTRRLPPAVERRAAARYDVVPNADDRQLGADEIVARAAGADAILCTPTDRIDRALVERLPEGVRIVATYSAGTDHIDLAAARARGIVVTNAPDVLTEATADIALLLMLGAARGAFEAQRVLRAGAWDRWTPTAFLGRDLAGARLGLVGMGRIAKATARRAAGFGMAVAYWNRREVADVPVAATFVPDLDDLFRSSDVVSLHVPGGAETNGLVDARRLALLPDGAVLVNTARGTLVDDDALLAELGRGRIAAGLDVFAGEPAVDPRYFTAPNTYLLPHIGSATAGTRDAMGFRALDNLDAYFDGRAPGDRVA